MRSKARTSEGDLPKQSQLYHGERQVELIFESLLNGTAVAVNHLENLLK